MRLYKLTLDHLGSGNVVSLERQGTDSNATYLFLKTQGFLSA